MIQYFFKAAKQAQSEAKWWAYAAWTLPFVALGILVVEDLVGWDEYISKTLTVISITFFTISVYWWWWALNKIVKILEGFQRTEQHFEDVKTELRETRKAIRGE